MSRPGLRYHKEVKQRLFLLIGLLLAGACNSTTTAEGPAPASSKSKATPAQVAVAPDVLVGLEVPPADPREPQLAEAVRTLLEREHLRPHPIDDATSEKAYAMLLERLDPGKLFLLKPHVDLLERDRKNLDDQLRARDFRFARTASALVLRERKEVAKVVAELLKEPFDFSVDEKLETDPEKRGWPKDAEERKELWRKTLKQQVLERIERMAEVEKARASGKQNTNGEEIDPKLMVDPPPPTFEGREKRAREDLAKHYEGRFSRLGKQAPLESAEMFINAFATVFDPHTLYMAPEQQEDFEIQISGSLEGIGAVLGEDDHYIVVREVVPGGAAFRQGKLEAGDLILAVKQAEGEAVDVVDMRINDVVRMIRGPKGTVVVLTVRKPDQRVQIIPITRDVVVVEDAYARGALLDLGPKHEAFGYISLPSFYGNTRARKGQTPERDATSDVRALLERFKAKKVKGVVLDLRGNGGGLLEHANDITGLFIDTGPVVAARGSDGRLQVLGDSEPGAVWEGEVVVLVDRFSASAAEILAGALQGYGRALVVGTGPTHGKGTVQAVADLDRLLGVPAEQPLGVMKLTVQQFFLVDGRSTQWEGVQPDIVLPDPAAHIESGERYLDHAIPFSQIPPLKTKPWQASWDEAALANKSKERQAAEAAFAKIQARGEYLLKRRADTMLPLKLDAWRAQREQDKKALEELDPKLDEGPPRFSLELVSYGTGEKAAPKNKAEAAESKGPRSRSERWQESLVRDPWVEEALRLLADMTEGAKGQKPNTKATATK